MGAATTLAHHRPSTPWFARLTKTRPIGRMRPRPRQGTSSVFAQRHAGQVNIKGMATRGVWPQLEVLDRHRHRERLDTVQNIDHLTQADLVELDIHTVLTVAARHLMVRGRGNRAYPIAPDV